MAFIYLLVDSVKMWHDVIIVFSLLIFWLVNLNNTVIHGETRKYMVGIAASLIVWYIVRVIRYRFVVEPVVSRYLWYSFYIPIIILPLFSFFTSICVGRHENYTLPKSIRSLYIPAAILLAVIYSNDFHELVFRFEGDMDVLAPVYTYNAGYYFIAAWVVIFDFSTLIVLYRRCNNPYSRNLIWVPALISLFILLYIEVYYLYPELPIFEILDFTLMCCIVSFAIWKVVIYSGMIATNSDYERLFDAMNIPADIVNMENEIVYHSKETIDVDTDTRLAARQEDVNLDKDNLLKCSKINAGYVYWVENIANINELIDELKEKREQLIGENDMISADIKVREELLSVKKKLEIFGTINKGVETQTHCIDKLIENIDYDNATETLAKICVYSSFVKRKCNLMLLKEDNDMASLSELALCIKESINYLALMNISGALNEGLIQVVDMAGIIDAYTWFEAVIEKKLDELSMIYVSMNAVEGTIEMSIMAELHNGEVENYNNRFRNGGALI